MWFLYGQAHHYMHKRLSAFPSKYHLMRFNTLQYDSMRKLNVSIWKFEPDAQRLKMFDKNNSTFCDWWIRKTLSMKYFNFPCSANCNWAKNSCIKFYQWCAYPIGKCRSVYRFSLILYFWKIIMLCIIYLNWFRSSFWVFVFLLIFVLWIKKFRYNKSRYKNAFLFHLKILFCMKFIFIDFLSTC